MKTFEYKDPTVENGKYIVFEIGDCEFVNPIEYYRDAYIQKQTPLTRFCKAYLFIVAFVMPSQEFESDKIIFGILHDLKAPSYLNLITWE